jgi:Interferon-induced transmembrane protein
MSNVYPDRDRFEEVRPTRPVADWTDDTYRGVDPFDNPPVTPNPYQRMRAADLYNPHLVLVVIATILFFPVGIFAVYMSSQISRRRAMGDSVGAMEASNRARLLGFIAIGLGIVGWLIFLIAACSAVMSYSYYGY